MERVVREEKLTPAQAYFIASNRKFMWFCAGIGSGKTRALAVYVTKMSLKYPKARGLIAANTFAQLHGSTLLPVFAYFKEIGMDYRVNKRPPESWLHNIPFDLADYKNVMVLENGAHIFLRSLDNPSPLRGLELGWAIIDEISSSTREAWDIIIGRMRDKECKEIQIRVVGTPDGANWTYEEFEKRFSKDPRVAALYDIVFMSARDNIFLPPGFLDSLLGSYDRRTALQEIDGRILMDQQASIYYEWRKNEHNKLVMPYNPHQNLILCWDFNSSSVAPMSMVIAQQHSYSNGVPFIQVLDEVVIYGGNTPMVCDTFLKRYYPHHKAGLVVYGDASGTRSTTGMTDYGAVKECLAPRFPDIRFVVPRKNMKEIDRRNAVNAMLLNAKGEVRLFVSDQCPELMLDFEKLKPDVNGKIDKGADQARSHTSDALGYFVAREFPVDLRKPVGINALESLNLGYRG